MSANTGTLAEPRPDRTTFGVELEFLVPWLLDILPDPLAKTKGLAPLFRVTRDSPDPEKDVHAAIRKLFEEHGLQTRVGIKLRKYSSAYAEKALHRYSAWIAKYDISVKEEDESNDWVRRYGWASVEVISPVEPTIPIAFENLNYARQLLTNTFRCRVNKTCGLHVHVGKGAERFDLANMRRISALIWSSEHLFVNLNHPDRQANHLIPTARKKTAISTGRGHGQHDNAKPGDPPDQCKDYLAKEVRYGEEPISFRDENRDAKIREAFATTREPSHYEPFQWTSGRQVHDADVPIDSARSIDEEILSRIEKMSVKTDFEGFEEIESDPARDRTSKRMENIRWSNDDLEAMALNPSQGINFHQFTNDPDVFEGVSQLYDSPSSCDIAWLMYPRGRGYVNFELYNCDEFGYRGAGPRNAGRTIEFRGAEGTLDSWAITWAKICVGMVRFALYAPVDEFLRVLFKCDASNRDIEKFDCIDFLDEIGLPAEAVLAEKHLKEKEKEYKIKYVDESEQPKPPE